MTKWLAAHPEWLGRLRASPEPAALAERIVRETLRLSQSEYIIRQATAPLSLDGFTIPRGWLVRVCIRDIHRRPESFAEPTQFRPDRVLDPPGPNLYAPFGASRISCLGEGVTLLFGRLLALELARGYDIVLAQDAPPELGAFHWQPGQAFRVRLVPLATATAPVR